MNIRNNAATKARRTLCAISSTVLALLISAARAETVTAEPDAFLDYIETTQDSSDYAKVTQYIDTGVKAATGIKARMDAVILSNTRSDSAILGARKGSDCRFLILHSNNKNAFAAYGKGNDGKWNDTVRHPLGLRFEEVADFSDGTAVQIYINGEPRVSQTQQSTIQSVAEDPETGSISAAWMDNLSLYLFAANNGGTAAWPCRIKLYELKIMKKNAETGKFDLLRHYLPCVKGDRAGLYDTVNRTISYSYGSADFVAGPVLDKPLDFVESITSDGKQWFDTGVYGKSGLKSEVDVSVLETSGDCCILGNRGTDGDTRFYMAYHHESAFRFGYSILPAKSTINVIAPKNDGTRYLIKTDMTVGSQSMTISTNGYPPVEILKSDSLVKNGKDYGMEYLATTNTLYLLANNKHGSTTCASKCVVYGVKLWDGDELLRDFVPVVATNSSGVAYAGLYDRVTERVFKQIGKAADDFDLDAQVGCVTNTLRTVARPKKKIEYVESDGNYDYVNLGVIANAGIETELTMEWLTIPSERAFLGARHVVQAGVSTPRVFPYSTFSTYTNDVLESTQHAYHYNNNRYTARDSANKAPAIEENVVYKVLSRLDKDSQSITVWEREDGGWKYLGTRQTTLEYDVNLNFPLYLFAINEDNLARFPVKARCRSLKLSVKQQDGSYALVRNLVPVRDPVTGGAALWDKVTETYFRNSGRYMLAGGGEERPLLQGLAVILR